MKGSCHCGTVSYEVAREDSGYVILRAASLDDDPGTRPQRRIWRSHDAPWLFENGEIPAYPEFPPEG